MIALRQRRAWFPLWLYYSIDGQQILGTKEELHLMHQHVHRKHSSDEIDKHLQEGQVAARHYLLQHRGHLELKPDLMDHLDTNRD